LSGLKLKEGSDGTPTLINEHGALSGDSVRQSLFTLPQTAEDHSAAELLKRGKFQAIATFAAVSSFEQQN